MIKYKEREREQEKVYYIKENGELEEKRETFLVFTEEREEKFFSRRDFTHTKKNREEKKIQI